jgi:hypothetical protein
MKSLFILVMMQLKEQMNFKRLKGGNARFFSTALAVVAAVLKFAAVTALCYAFLLVAKQLGLFSFADYPIPDTVISIVFSVMLAVSIISCTAGLTKAMYYARDNAVLLTLPCTPLQVYLSKLIIFFIFEIKRNLSFLVPLFTAYYLSHGYEVWTYAWMLFCMILVSLFTVAIGAIFSIPAMWIANFFRQHKWMQIATLVTVVATATVVLFWGISLIPANIDILAAWDVIYWEIQDFLAAYAKNFSALYDLTRMLLGNNENLTVIFRPDATIMRFLVLVGATAVSLGIGLLIVRPLFYKMASTPFEYLKKAVKPKKNKVRRPLASSIYTNFLTTVKNTTEIYTNVGILISVPMLIFLLNKIFHAMKTREMGDHMIIAFNILIMLLVVLNSNCSISSLYSRDGRSSYLIKTLPSSYTMPILTKLLPNATFGLLSIIATMGVLVLTLPLEMSEIVMIIASIAMIYIAHLFYSAQLDLMNPQNQLYSSVGSSVSNPNETKSTLWAFIISFVTAAVVFLLLNEKSGNVYTKLLIVAFAACIYRTYTFFEMLKLYYKEK